MHVARHPVSGERPLSPAAPRCGVRREFVFGALLVLLDALAFSCAYLGFLHLRWLEGSHPPGAALSNLGPLLLCLAAVGLVFIAAGRYSLRTDSDTVRFAAEHGLACLIALALALLLQFAVFIFDLSRSREALVAAFVVFAQVSLVFRRILSRTFRARAETQTFLIIGAGAEAVRFYRACGENGTAQRLRFVDPAGTRVGRRLDGPGSPLVEGGLWKNFVALVDSSLEAIVVAEPLSHLPDRIVEAMVRTHFYHAPILTVETFHEKYWRKIPVVAMEPVWALRQDFRLARDSSYRFFKRAMDIVAAAAGLVLMLPFGLLVALAIRLESAGPVFYCQQRVRRDREVFTLYKFRTMRNVGPGYSSDDLYTLNHDRRVTRVGFWLRRLRLDELPQLWNVLKGDMSLIGPRAEWERCVQLYEREIPCYHFRHLVKPGITGWAQVNFPYGGSIDDTVEKLQYDLYYIKNYSLLLDASIVLKTLYVMLSFKGR
jgi:exopolysaccharide biosynthesis polyprenyl glycosylphosphotransferase